MLFKKTVQLYKSAYGGLPPAIWWNSFVMLINRCGTMVIPFMTLYITKHLHYTLGDASLVMACFGVGSIMGAALGGRLTDRIGFYPVQACSLLMNGVMFAILSFMQTIPQICICIFFLSLMGDAFRPANAAAIAHYSTPELRTRSYALNRFAMNMGWAIGLSIGGFLAAIGYQYLFWVDGFTCVTSALLILIFLKNVKRDEQRAACAAEVCATKASSPYRDHIYIAFIVLVYLFAVCFMQMFNITPLFFKDVLKMNETAIGWNLAINGVLIAATEIVLIYKLENKLPSLVFIAIGTLMVGASYMLMTIFPFVWVATLYCVVITYGEIFAMPFMNSFWISRSQPQNRGQYAALYSMAYSAAHVSAPFLGAYVVLHVGFNGWFYVLAGICVLAALGYWCLQKKVIQESKLHEGEMNPAMRA
ncbi:putative MFS family arabinose efflux permease [Chitinophaga skermanii]|uniref:Putative MFS family arabinose efflux permease n=1 Tax=Chitinophaga skermanii TaxID=331697 RepID=A0A327QTC7_9BACT|nr:MFS transporter [Chitinophaga skermanii]RAJ06904.1 putative MFS family arabinose efflux permease [Chitinophaga skermanii]